MKKKARFILSIIMIITMLCAAQLPAAALPETEVIPAGTELYFDNTNTQWTDVYIYGWDFGFAGDFLPLQRVGETNFYSYRLPEDVTVGTYFCLFINKNSWSGAVQTREIAYPSTAVNTVVPASGTSPVNYTWTYTLVEAVPFVSATPSKTFMGTLDVVLNEYCYSAKYSTDNRATYTPYTNGTVVTISETTTFHLRGYDANGKLVASAAYTYTKVNPTTVTVSVTGYTGDLTVYMFGGDRIDTVILTLQPHDNIYRLQFEGAASLVFCTTGSWDEIVMLHNDPLFVAAGTTTHFEFTYPPA